ncbi:radical SAM family heme chaperone HemW [Chlorogloea sp. CCALA 695]|uniref:radical SAM family heme chaperone HemW n=1 Tax=Chlorogloea sp. CCALA 695 TaxID=2107693 RepID=UPI000D081D9E|nr:radical SAM family heme chaperone HemW [Chlorogloea sp. CCALA 695]PSB34047.1 coproporphyrinogen III oxidase [Chlorogloea sp. CCALA 695]
MLSELKQVFEPLIIEIPSSAYVHIPFCRRRCFYCDFPVKVVGDRARGENSPSISDYVRAIKREIAATPNIGKPLETVFFGGGTPSLLSANQITQIIESLVQQFGLSSSAEISMEIDPGTFDLEQLQGYVKAGINRVSMGVQAFEQELLQVCGRSHSVDDIWRSIDIIRQVNVPSFSLDLISGLPHQTLAQWQESLLAAVKIAPNHISIYDLTIEPVTAFGKYYKPGVAPLPTDELTAQMYRQSREILTAAGYEHYEISNYALAGYQCRHNRVYWENRSYYGFGMGATSYVEGQRYTRPRKTTEYYDWVRKYTAAYGVIDCPLTPVEEMLLETLMLGLRLQEGVNLSSLSQLFGVPTGEKIEQCLQPYQKQGWIEFVTREKFKYARFTDPEGFLFSNVVLAALFERLT